MTFHQTSTSHTANSRVQPPSAPLGEVVESTTTDFVAQACVLDQAPEFGTFVEVGADDTDLILGVVARVETGGIDPGARTIMRGYGEVRDQQIYVENPDLPHVLRTTFRALTVGFVQHGEVYQFLPPRPPRLHFSVRQALPGTVAAFTDAGLDYLDVLLAAFDVSSNEVVAANIRAIAALRPDGPAYVQRAGRELAHLLRADYGRLSTILRRLSTDR